MIRVLTGSNESRIKQELRAAKAQFVTEYGDFGCEDFTAPEASYDKLLESVQAMPFLADKRQVVITGVAGNKELIANMSEFLKQINEQTDVILVEPKFDKRSSAYKTLKKLSGFNEYSELDEQGLVRWLGEEVKEQDGSITSSDARYLVGRVGADQLKLSNELAKLLAYAPHITKESIDLLTVPAPHSTVFELLDAAFSGQTRKVLTLYEEQRRQKVEPQEILGLLVWQLHVLAVVKAAGTAMDSDIASRAKINPYVVRKTRGLVRGISPGSIRQLTRQVLELDVRLKSESIDADAAMQNLLIGISNT